MATVLTGGLACWRASELPEPFRAAERAAIGTTARAVVWPASVLEPALAAIDEELARLDQEVSRFQPSSELSRIATGLGNTWVVSERLGEAVSVALEAARWTGGRVDPTVGNALVALGYDRDFAQIADAPGCPPQGAAAGQPQAVPGWRSITVEGRLLRAPEGTLIDLGATAKALAAERAAEAIAAGVPRLGGVLVSLGGDISTAGEAPSGGWPIMLADSHLNALSAAGPVVRLCRGGLATSSITARRWRYAGEAVHHIVDPSTGRPVEGPWRTVSVAAASCVDANAASTAALVAGADAEQWLSSTGFPSRIVGHDGAVVLIGGWPAGKGKEVKVPSFTVCRPRRPASVEGARRVLHVNPVYRGPGGGAAHANLRKAAS
jgi:FAD:protein FMN transferase